MHWVSARMPVLHICIFVILLTVSRYRSVCWRWLWMNVYFLFSYIGHPLSCRSSCWAAVSIRASDSSASLRAWLILDHCLCTSQHWNIINYIHARLLTWCSLTAVTHQVRHTAQGSKGRSLSFAWMLAQGGAGFCPKIDVYWSTMYYFYASVQHSDSAVCDS